MDMAVEGSLIDGVGTDYTRQVVFGRPARTTMRNTLLPQIVCGRSSPEEVG